MEIIQDDQGKPTRLFEGRVKCILSGDTMIIWPTGTKSGSVEREITLSLCMAPRMGKMPRILDVSEFKEEVIKKKLIYSSKKKKNFYTFHFINKYHLLHHLFQPSQSLFHSQKSE